MRPELIKASDLLQRNTPEALAEAIGLLQNTVYSFSMKMCGHREDAEDTSQEVLFRSLKHLPKLQNPSALAAWLYTVTRNRCHRMRSSFDASPARKVPLDELMPDQAELSRLLFDTAKSPEGKLLRAEERQLLHQAILRIPAQLRIVLVLHDMEELDTELVARILDLRPGTARVRLHRARLVLRKEMAVILKGALTGASAPRKRKAPSRKARDVTRRPRECRELFASLSEYLDGRVNSETCDKMSAHIEACPACVAFLRDLRAAIARCRSLESPCDPAVTSRLQAVLTREYLRMMGMASSAENATRV
jgi:RNA polymerase sigma-70 factor (ECF subfamily)